MYEPASASDLEDDGLHLKPGSIVSGNRGDYAVVKLLGEGGFGAVYRVQYKDDTGLLLEYAMKVEKKVERRKHSKLKMEVAILKELKEPCEASSSADKDKTETTNNTNKSRETVKANDKRVSHFTDIIDRGRKERYFFLVMTLVGPSLDDMKRLKQHKVFSLGTGLAVGIQCLEAVEQLHVKGYIHRDLKPANYARGLGAQRRVVYLLDFGIARKYLNSEKELKTPRAAVAFKGTVRFASLNCHRNREMGPKDDCESWFYLLLDCLVPTGLPWKKMTDRAEVLRCKEEMRQDAERRRRVMFNGIPYVDYLNNVLDYIDHQGYTDRIDYSYIYQNLQLTANECHVSLDAPYDWEQQPDATKTRKKQTSTKTCTARTRSMQVASSRLL